MTRREAWLSAAAIFLVAVAIRCVAAGFAAYPVPEDTAYYVDASANLVHGRGFVVDALWSYQTPPLVLPRPAFEVWLPLPSLLVAVPMALFGEGLRAAQVASILVGALIPVLAWRLAADVAEELGLPEGRARTLAIGSGLVTAVLAAAVIYSVLPDSTAPFGVLTLGACLLTERIARSARASSALPTPRDRRVLALGAVLGAAALCRAEAVWLAAAWLAVAWLWLPGTRGERARLIAAPALVAAIIFLPWVVRDWIVFGQPLPGQTVVNALSVRPTDIYAYRDQPTLARYLAQGPVALVEMRIGGTLHNLVNVLLLPALPTGFIGLLALPRILRIEALRPLMLVAALGFLSASLIFPVATTWGTFLHGSLAIDVLLVIAALLGLDALIVRIGRLRGWTRPVAWLGPAFAIAVAVPLTGQSLVALSGTSRDTEARYGALAGALADAGVTLDGHPVISDHPIWFARATGNPAIALPDEPPQDVLQLARDFGARLIVVQIDGTTRWPAVLSQAQPAAQCFAEVPLMSTAADTSGDARGVSGASRHALEQIRVFQVLCT